VNASLEDTKLNDKKRDTVNNWTIMQGNVMTIANKHTTSVPNADADSYCLYVEVKQLRVELGKGSN
jgi:hypothetical protein